MSRAGRRTTLIAGHEGQDGRLLWELLSRRGDRLAGLGRRGSTAGPGLDPAILEGVRVTDRESVERLVRRLAPDQVYYLAAHHGPAEAACQLAPGASLAADLREALEVNVLGAAHFLEAIRRHSPATRLFYASSSLIFGPGDSGEPQDESTPPRPQCTYALTKALGGQVAREYRSRHGLFAAVGILYNHESPLRARGFVTRKVTRAALEILHGRRETLTLGSLGTIVDWGWAEEYAEAFTRILDLDQPDDFIVATGRGHTVQDLVECAFGRLGLDWHRHVRVREGITPEHRDRVGDPSKLRRFTGWEARASLPEIVERLLQAAAGETGLALPAAEDIGAGRSR